MVLESQVKTTLYLLSHASHSRLVQFMVKTNSCSFILLVLTVVIVVLDISSFPPSHTVSPPSESHEATRSSLPPRRRLCSEAQLIPDEPPASGSLLQPGAPELIVATLFGDKLRPANLASPFFVGWFAAPRCSPMCYFHIPEANFTPKTLIVTSRTKIAIVLRGEERHYTRHFFDTCPGEVLSAPRRPQPDKGNGNKLKQSASESAAASVIPRPYKTPILLATSAPAAAKCRNVSRLSIPSAETININAFLYDPKKGSSHTAWRKEAAKFLNRCPKRRQLRPQ
ncbi:hypothetical protein E2C01_040115 [Portunus trituberculatus]|uniref:Uncharacterized protein n=1 Tax=Portunus trituberculatus TaxID=210409 RepID=A0A5B7FPU7_PORTR|nr:hypothetical protein [Portunus trituberculatus]